MSRRVPATALLLLIAMAGGVSGAVEKSSAIQVEVLVFTQPGADGSSLWQDSRSLPVCHAVALRDGSGAEAAYTDSSSCVRKPGMDAAYGGFSATGNNAVPAHAAKLKSANYMLLVNQTWRQANTNLAPVVLRGGKTVGSRQELEGTLTLANTTAGTEATLDLVLTRLDGEKPQYVTLQETRVIKAGETNYFDHPMFGVLLQTSTTP